VAPVFPYIDLPLDDRYEGFLAHLGASGGDQYLFDGRGVTGMHAIERIIYIDTTPPLVVEAEATLPGYKAAALPATPQEAADFKNLLCGKAISDATLLRREWDSAQWNASLAFSGLVSLLTEQREKVNKASSQEEESRYSQRTMADLHENLAGTKRFYEYFAPWILSKPAPNAGGMSGRDIDAKIRAGFAEMEEGYARVPGAAIPTPPDTWSANPSPQDLASPFGKLFTLVSTAANPNVPSSVVANMNNAADLLHFAQ
jgi:iron uptake system component EfeO